jgi:uncharacterized protein YfaS (alpha-2-macroglobulin family)
MQIHNGSMKSSRFRFFFPAALLVIASAGLVESFQTTQSATGDSIVATYSPGVLSATISYHAPHVGVGQLTVEVLDPEDGVLGRIQRSVNVSNGKGWWLENLKLKNAVAVEDLAWHRLRYRFSYSGQKSVALQGTESISQILLMPVIHILAQQSYLSGGPAAVRVVVTDSKNNSITSNSSLRIDLVSPGQKPVVLFFGRLNRRGTTEAQFQFPAGTVGAFQLHYLAETPIGSTEFTQQVRLEDKASILLTTEKPIYQPGQTIHARALALERGSHEATAGRRLTFEVEDSRGNKVFKRVTQTDQFGIASAEFGLADEVNLGTYHLRALMDGAEAGHANSAEIALNVERYVLPKFKVAVEFGDKDSKTKRGYRPGDHVTGTVRANYFFGKPVDAAEIAVKAFGMDVAQFDAGSVHGKTDADGAYRFDLPLPTYFAGRPLSQGVARVLIEATVKDSAGHSEARGEPITVSESPLIVTAVPEGGTLIPNLENQVFILASYPDGSPARADVAVHVAGKSDQTVATDEGGVAVIRLNADEGSDVLHIDATDREGNHAVSTAPLQARTGADQILLRTERAVYRAGDRIQLRVFSTKERGSAYVDIVKDGQTVLTRDLDIVNGQAELALTATPEMAGALDCNAYLFGRDARPVGDHRLVFVQPADELKIETAVDAPVYKPGDDARVSFRVTNSRGEGVQAALGLQVVDEAVFALAEKQPGFAKVFFYLEQEVMKPRYEIHSIGMPGVVATAEKADVEQQNRAARALFSATEIVSTNKFETEVGRTVPQTKYAAYAQRYNARFQAQVSKLAEGFTHAYAGTSGGVDLTQVTAPEVQDAWDTNLRVEHVSWNPQQMYMVRSAGPDKRFNTADDMLGYLEVNTRKIVGTPEPLENGGGIDLKIEHDRGPFNGLAELAGSVKDQTGAAIVDASMKVRSVSTGKMRTARPDAAGQFSLAGLTAGEYEVDVSSPGFRTASQKVTLKVRDRAILSATLTVGSVTETVEVVAASVIVGTGFGGGIGSGRGGGVGGGGGPGGFNMDGTHLGQAFAGGVVGGILGATPMALPMNGRDEVMFPNEMFADDADSGAMFSTTTKPSAAAPHVRSYFPEALYINPEIITDHDGRASISIPLADSITTWRMAMLASTTHGALGSGTSSIKVFQDFFVDLDMPVTVTQGDRVSIPVAAYNYSSTAGNVNLQLQSGDWYSLIDDVPEKTIAVDAGRVGGSQFTLEAQRIGKFKLTLSARMGTPLGPGANRADIVVREIEVVPNGREQTTVFNGRLEAVLSNDRGNAAVHHELNFPVNAISGAGAIIVRLYPGPLSQVIEGMDSILRMPGGCFEQTSSSTYPNVLALDYMKRTNKLTPEVHAKAEGYIANGYQRLLTFEVPGGGFSWFGQAPANKILTSYGLMEFSDMSKVYDVDPRLIQRTQQWLASQQQPNGSWKPDTNFINEGATNRYNSNVLRITAYIAWSLQNTGYRGQAVEKARQFIQQNMGGQIDSYTLAVLANFAADYGKDREFTNQAARLLIDARTEKDEQAWWTAEETSTYAAGASASVETTGLAVQALLKWGEDSATARKAIAYITSKKDASGAWGSTQATILALRALLLASEKGASDARGSVEISLNGKPVETLTLTPDNNDLLHQFVFKNVDAVGANKVDIRFDGKGGLAYQVAGRYFLPWSQKPAGEPLSIDVAYDRTHLAQDDIATATAAIRNNLTKPANMVMVDLGIPPGFDLLSEDLQDYAERSAGLKSGRLEKFSLTATQAILYFDSFAPGSEVTLKFRLRAKYPIRAQTFASRVYEYYSPDVNSVARPVQLEVRKR